MIIKGNYIVIHHSDGRVKVYTIRKYKTIRFLKSAALIVGALAAVVFFCGACAVSEHPLRPLQIVISMGISAFILVCTIYFSISSYKNDD